MPASLLLYSSSMEDEFQRNPELKEQDLQHLREWNRKEPHLPIVPDDQLVLFLHSCYFSLERAKKTIEACFTIRTLSPEFFAQRDPLLPELRAAWNVIDVIPMPEPDPSGYRVVLCRLAVTEPCRFVHADAIKVFLFAMDAIISKGTTPGYRFIYDVKGLSLGHLSRFNMTLVRKYMVYVQEGLRVRMKSVNVINHSPIIDKFLNIIRPLMKQEMAQQLRFHRNMEDLYKVVPQRILPSDYGGSAGSVDSLKGALWMRVESMRGWLLQNEQLKVDEKKRRGMTVNSASIFGLEGSFKKLDID